MSKYDFSIGSKFAYIEISSEQININGKQYFECKCKCGIIKLFRKDVIARGIKTISCGCMARKKKNLIGKRFGRLVVIRLAGLKTKCGQQYWLCKCDCGKEKEVRQSLLETKDAVSCGCFQKESRYGRLLKDKHPKYRHDLSEEERIDQRKLPEYSMWRKSVYRKFKYTCQKCNIKCKKRQGHAHHIESYDKNPTLRLDINNGIVLCKKCHKSFHKLYGYGSNTRNQLEEFLNQHI